MQTEPKIRLSTSESRNTHSRYYTEQMTATDRLTLLSATRCSFKDSATAAVAWCLERPPCEREVVGSISVRDRPKSFKLVVVAFSLNVQDYRNSATTVPPVSG